MHVGRGDGDGVVPHEDKQQKEPAYVWREKEFANPKTTTQTERQCIDAAH